MECTVNTNYDGEGPDVCEDKIVTARKEYRCIECRDVIKPGDKYEYTRGLWDGRWSTFRTCILCLRIRKDFFCSWVYGDMRQDFFEEYGFDYCGKWEDAEWVEKENRTL